MVSHKNATWTLTLDPLTFWGNPVLEPTTSTPSPRKILDFHDTISKSTQDLGFFNNHTRVSRKLAGTFVVFQVLLLFTNASFISQKFSERQSFGSIALPAFLNWSYWCLVKIMSLVIIILVLIFTTRYISSHNHSHSYTHSYY